MLFNKWQPERPRIHPVTGAILQYRTMPKKEGHRLRPICTLHSRITQMRLYRAACQGYVPIQVSIAELYNFCFGETVSKNQMGTVIIDTVIYEPRLLVNNKTVGKATMTYTFRSDLDLKYGLEWMICTWLWKFLNENAAPDALIGTPEQMAQELEMLGGSDDMEYIEIYESQSQYRFSMDEPDWKTVCNGMEEWVPEEPVQPRSPAPPPRDLSLLRR